MIVNTDNDITVEIPKGFESVEIQKAGKGNITVKLPEGCKLISDKLTVLLALRSARYDCQSVTWLTCGECPFKTHEVECGMNKASVDKNIERLSIEETSTVKIDTVKVCTTFDDISQYKEYIAKRHDTNA